MISLAFIVFIIPIIVIIHFYFQHSFTYFKSKNIPYIKPSFPLGNIQLSFFRKYGQALEEFYRIFRKRGDKIAGIYMCTKPVLMLIDRDIIKDVLTKNFQDFNTRGMYYNEEKEFLTAHLGAINGPSWKSLRSKLTPIFSSSKLKSMFHTMLEKAANLERILEECEKLSTPFESKELAVKLTTDMFCSLFLGVDCNSLIDSNEEFPKFAQKLLHTNFMDGVRMSLTMTAPQVADTFNIPFVRKDFADFFINCITKVVEYREKNLFEKQDFMNLLVKLKNCKNIDGDNKTSTNIEEKITLKQLIAQCFVFFVGGVDTSATTISYCLFELSQNQNLQNRLREEICNVIEKNNGDVTYDGVMKMKLLEKVIYETLRKYPAVLIVNRKCTNDYVVPGTDIRIEKDSYVCVSIKGIHHDPDYYPEPDKFDPERFSEEEKAKRLPYTYLPFGEGPRICIGYRFGMMQVKLGIIFFLRNYKFTLNPKTKLPLEFKTELVLLANYNKILINAEKNE